jgi:predicted glycosyltransferase
MYQQVSMPTVWIDLENTPHVPFFGPIIRTLEQRGIEVILTARDFAQTVALLERNQMTAMVIGGEYGKDTLSKILGLSARALTLRTKLKEQQIDLAIGHGSRGLLLASKLMRISSLTMYDYEGASVGFFNKFSTLVLTPEVVGKALLQKHRISPKKLRTYPGIKEDVYAGELKPDGSIYRALGLDPRKIIVTIRPPSDTAHYRSDQSQQLFDAIVQLLTQREDIEMLISARTRDQRQRLSTTYKDRSHRCGACELRKDGRHHLRRPGDSHAEKTNSNAGRSAFPSTCFDLQHDPGDTCLALNKPIFDGCR